MAMRENQIDVPIGGLPGLGQPPDQGLTPPPLPPPGPGVPLTPPPLGRPEGALPLGNDLIGDIPPPPTPDGGAKASKQTPPLGVGVAGAPGTMGSTFARPGTAAIAPFRSPAAAPPPTFGPGVPVAGGAPGVGSPDDVGELLRQLAANRSV